MLLISDQWYTWLILVYLWHNTLPCSPLTYDIYATVLNHMTCLFSGFHTASLFCSCEGDLGCINSTYCDLRYMVYIYEGFLVWIISSMYQSHESIIWAYTTSFIHTAWCLFACLCVHMLSTPSVMHVFWFRFIDTHVLTWFWIYY